jgi:hypothetical protein
LVTLCPEKNVNLAHTYTLVGGSGIAIPELPLTRFPGQDPGGSGAWNRPQKLRSGPGPGQGPGPVLGPGPGIPDPLPRDGDPRPPGPEVRTGVQDRRSLIAIPCRSMLSIEGDAGHRPCAIVIGRSRTPTSSCEFAGTLPRGRSMRRSSVATTQHRHGGLTPMGMR